jgi:hypothetical protein
MICGVQPAIDMRPIRHAFPSTESEVSINTWPYGSHTSTAGHGRAVPYYQGSQLGSLAVHALPDKCSHLSISIIIHKAEAREGTLFMDASLVQ